MAIKLLFLFGVLDPRDPNTPPPCEEYLDATGDLGGIEDAGNGSIRLKCWKDPLYAREN